MDTKKTFVRIILTWSLSSCNGLGSADAPAYRVSNCSRLPSLKRNVT